MSAKRTGLSVYVVVAADEIYIHTPWLTRGLTLQSPPNGFETIVAHGPWLHASSQHIVAWTEGVRFQVLSASMLHGYIVR